VLALEHVMPKRLEDFPLCRLVQVLPPLVVTMIDPLNPTAIQLLTLRQAML